MDNQDEVEGYLSEHTGHRYNAYMDDEMVTLTTFPIDIEKIGFVRSSICCHDRIIKAMQYIDFVVYERAISIWLTVAILYTCHPRLDPAGNLRRDSTPGDGGINMATAEPELRDNYSSLNIDVRVYFGES